MMEYLLDDYLILYLDTNDKKFLKSAIGKLVKCGFKENVATEIINLEIDIIKFRKKISKPIINSYFWLDKIDLFSKDSNASLFDNRINDLVMLRYDSPKAKISEYTLTLSELCMLFDEAWSICHRFKKYVPENMYNECYSIAKDESMDSWVIREFKTRLEEMYRSANNITGDYNELLASKQINNLYNEELKILLSQKEYNKFIL